MLRSGLSPRADWTLPFDATGADLLALFDRDEPPTAVVAGNDHTAIRVIELLERRGLDVPHHVSIVGFDGVAAAGLARIALTTIAQPRDELVREAMQLLVTRIELGQDAPPEQQRMPPELIVRGSTAPPSG
jgi:DNA-binding LacI/PurR family transcriptional regulator